MMSVVSIYFIRLFLGEKIKIDMQTGDFFGFHLIFVRFWEKPIKTWFVRSVHKKCG